MQNVEKLEEELEKLDIQEKEQQEELED